MISLFFGCFSFLTPPTPNIQCQIQGERKFLMGDIFLGTCLLQRSTHLVILSSTCHPNLGFLIDLVFCLEEIILCYLTLFSQVYFFRYLIKNFEVSIRITLMSMMTSCSAHIVYKKAIMNMWISKCYILCSDAYSQDTCYMCMSFTLCFYSSQATIIF